MRDVETPRDSLQQAGATGPSSSTPTPPLYRMAETKPHRPCFILSRYRHTPNTFSLHVVSKTSHPVFPTSFRLPLGLRYYILVARQTTAAASAARWCVGKQTYYRFGVRHETRERLSVLFLAVASTVSYTSLLLQSVPLRVLVIIHHRHTRTRTPVRMP